MRKNVNFLSIGNRETLLTLFALQKIEDNVMSELDILISQKQLKRNFGNVSDMTIWRWRRSGTIPQPVKINGRNFYRQSELLQSQTELFAHSEDYSPQPR